MYFVYMCENRTLKPVEISLREENPRWQPEHSHRPSDLLSRDFDKKLKTCLIGVKHQGELKHQHSEPLARRRPLHATIY
jgi:hypothetical protein